MDYFPPSTIPEWPKRPHRGEGRRIQEFTFDVENVGGHCLKKARIEVVSALYNEGRPLTCIQCGRPTTEDAEVACDH